MVILTIPSVSTPTAKKDPPDWILLQEGSVMSDEDNQDKHPTTHSGGVKGCLARDSPPVENGQSSNKTSQAKAWAIPVGPLWNPVDRAREQNGS